MNLGKDSAWTAVDCVLVMSHSALNPSLANTALCQANMLSKTSS